MTRENRVLLREMEKLKKENTELKKQFNDIALRICRDKYLATAASYPGSYPSRGAVYNMLSDAFTAGWMAAKL